MRSPRQATQPPSSPSDPLVSVRQFIERLDIGASTFHRWRRDGYLPPALKLGPRTIKWRSSDVERFLASAREDGSTRSAH